MATETEPDSELNDFDKYEDDDEIAQVIPDIEDMVDANGKLLNQHPTYNQIINAEVSLQLGYDMSIRKVTK